MINENMMLPIAYKPFRKEYFSSFLKDKLIWLILINLGLLLLTASLLEHSYNLLWGILTLINMVSFFVLIYICDKVLNLKYNKIFWKHFKIREGNNGLR